MILLYLFVVGGTNYENQQGIVNAVQKVEEGEGQDKHVSSQPQEELDIITRTSDQTEQVKSNKEFANKIQNNETVVAATMEESNENDKYSNTEQVPQVSGQGVSCTVSSRDLGDKNLMNADDTVTVVTAQNERGDSISDNNGSGSSRDLGRKTTHDEKDLPVTQVIATPSDQDIGENEKTSTMEKSEEVQELTMNDSDLNVIQATATSSDQDIADNKKPSTNDKSEEKQGEINSATIASSAADTTAEKSTSLITELHVSGNQLDAVDEASEHPGPCVNSSQSVNKEMALDQGKFSQASYSSVVQIAYDLDQDALEQKLTDETVVEVRSEKSGDEYENRLNSETALPQFGHTSSEPLMAESRVQITAQEKNSESVLSCAGSQQEENSSDNHESTVTSLCGKEGQPQLRDSGSLLANGEVKNSVTEAMYSMPSRDIDAENRLITALRLSCKLSPGHLVKDLDAKGVMSIHLLRSLSPGVVTVAELVHKLVYLTELDLSGNLLGPQGFRVICLALRRNRTLKCLNLANNLADTDSSVSTSTEAGLSQRFEVVGFIVGIGG